MHEPALPRDRTRTEAELVAATRRLIDTTGRTRFTVTEVCTAVGYTRGAFYSSFSSINELTVAVHEQQNSDLAEAVADASERAAQVSTSENSLRRRIDALQASLSSYAVHDQALAERLIAQRVWLHRALSPHLLALAERSNRTLTTDVTTYTRAIMAAYAGASIHLVAPDDTEDLRPLLLETTITGLTQPRT